MTQEEKQLVLQDLCARLQYGAKVKCPFDDDPYTLLSINWNKEIVVVGFMMDGIYVTSKQKLENIKPCLRPLSSMTEAEKVEYCDLQDKFLLSSQCPVTDGYVLFDWLDKKMFDYRGLIPKGRAIEVTKNNNPYKD